MHIVNRPYTGSDIIDDARRYLTKLEMVLIPDDSTIFDGPDMIEVSVLVSAICDGLERLISRFEGTA
jgi:hypothetical protein